MSAPDALDPVPTVTAWNRRNPYGTRALPTEVGPGDYVHVQNPDEHDAPMWGRVVATGPSPTDVAGSEVSFWRITVADPDDDRVLYYVEPERSSSVMVLVEPTPEQVEEAEDWDAR